MWFVILLGILAFADALRDPAALSRHVEQSFTELHASVTTPAP